MVNGKVVATPIADAVCPKGRPGLADAVAKDGPLVVTVGEPDEGRTKRAVRLIEPKK